MGRNERRFEHGRRNLPWGRAVPLGVALALCLPAVALLRVESLVPFDADLVVRLVPVPDGEWSGAWGGGARTATAVRAEAFEAALWLVVGLSLVAWSSALVLAALGTLRRVAAERSEWALRSALGATRRRLRAELCREGLGTSFAATLIGLPLAAALLELGVRARPAAVLVAGDAGASLLLRPPAVTLVGATALALVAMPLLVLPAARLLRRPASADLAVPPGAAVWLLGAAQVAAAVATAGTAVLLAGAAPAPETTRQAHPQARDTLVLRARLPAGADPATSWDLVCQAVERVEGVEVASVTSPGAILGLGSVDRTAATCASCRAGGVGLPVTFAWARHLAVDEGFFELLAIHRPRPPGAGSLALGEGLARRLFQAEDPVGQRLWTRGASPLGTGHATVGLVVPEAPMPAGPWLAGSRGEIVDASSDVVLVRLADAAPRTADVVLLRSRARGGMPVGEAIRAISRRVPGAEVWIVGRLDRLLEDEAAPLRWSAGASAGLGAAALLFALLGLVAGMAERVRERRPEIGLRRALGASRIRIVRLVLADAARLAAAGTLLGATIAASIGRGLTDLLRGASPLTPGQLAGLALVAVAIGVAVSAGEAVRAARLDPVTALRD